MSADTPPTLGYPVEFPIKVFLRPGAEHEAAVLAALRACLNPGNTLDYTRVSSSGGRYVCLRLHYTAQDAEEVARLRLCLQADARVILSL